MDEDHPERDGACGAPGALREARRVREAARGNGSLERRDRASGRLHHRLFSQITMNWRGRPLNTHQIIVDLISNTTSATGLTVHCVLDTDQYPIGIKYTKKDVDALPITYHDFHGEWNYSLQPTTRP